jgi:hypothetical protein
VNIPLGLSGTEGISRLLEKSSKSSSASIYLSFRSSLVSNKLAAAGSRCPRASTSASVPILSDSTLEELASPSAGDIAAGFGLSNGVTTVVVATGVLGAD